MDVCKRTVTYKQTQKITKYNEQIMFNVCTVVQCCSGGLNILGGLELKRGSCLVHVLCSG